MTAKIVARRLFRTARKTQAERFLEKVERVPFTDCWIWIGAGDDYGVFWTGVRQTMAHRASFELYKGQIQKGLQIDHLCRVHCCVNPDHLEAVTPKVNTNRGIGSEVNRARHAAVTHCPQGHEYSGRNLYRYPDGRRRCRKCSRDQMRAKRAGLAENNRKLIDLVA